MRIAALSDPHVLGPAEAQRTYQIYRDIGLHHAFWRRKWHRALMRVRRRLWNWRPEHRYVCFVRALDEIALTEPDLVVAVGDLGGDAAGVGISADEAFESVRRVVELLRATFPDRVRFVYGDHEIGKHSTELRRGGIRLESIRRGTEELKLPLFWHERLPPWHVIGVCSTLLLLDLFVPEALPAELDTWHQLRARHIDEICTTFRALDPQDRVLLFLHDPGALSVLDDLPDVRWRRHQIAHTVVGHLHQPALLPLTRMFSRLPTPTPRYPVARIIAHAVRGAHRWGAYRPVVCPSTFGAGHYFSGGILVLESHRDGRLTPYRRRVRCW